MFQTVFVEKIKIQVMFSNIFPKIVPFMRYVEKCIGAVQAEDGTMIESMCFTF